MTGYACKSVPITTVNGKIEFQDDPERKKQILVRTPTNCSNGSVLVPSDQAQAINWLDLALPMDAKKAALQGHYISIAGFSSYGVSVNADLSNFFYQSWHLDNREKICSADGIRSPTITSESSCFMKLFYRWREFHIEESASPARSSDPHLQ